MKEFIREWERIGTLSRKPMDHRDADKGVRDGVVVEDQGGLSGSNEDLLR